MSDPSCADWVRGGYFHHEIPRYWAKATHQTLGEKGEPLTFSCSRWSDQSFEDARGSAVKFAREIASKFLAGALEPQYPYGDRVLPEERIKDFVDEGGNATAVITRNSYGALILNTSRIMFVDFDVSERPSLLNSIKRLFGYGPNFEQEILARVTTWASRHSRSGMRLYQTAKGYRGLVTHSEFDPKSEATERILTDLGCDPLCIKLCKTQECFRARLTPKFWRCRSLSALPNRFPWEPPKMNGSFGNGKRPTIMKEVSTRPAGLSQQSAMLRRLLRRGS